MLDLKLLLVKIVALVVGMTTSLGSVLPLPIKKDEVLINKNQNNVPTRGHFVVDQRPIDQSVALKNQAGDKKIKPNKASIKKTTITITPTFTPTPRIPTSTPAPTRWPTLPPTATPTPQPVLVFGTNRCPENSSMTTGFQSKTKLTYQVSDDNEMVVGIKDSNGKEVLPETNLKGSGKLIDLEAGNYLFTIKSIKCETRSDSTTAKSWFWIYSN